MIICVYVTAYGFIFVALRSFTRNFIFYSQHFQAINVSTLYEGDSIMSQALINTRYTMQTYQNTRHSAKQHFNNIENFYKSERTQCV